MKLANLALNFLLELAVFAGLAYWGARVGHGAGAVVLGIAAPGRGDPALGSPRRAKVRTSPAASARVVFELGVFAFAAVALLAADATVAALVFAGLAAVNAVLLATFDQLDA